MSTDIVERLENSLKVNPTHMLRLGDIAEAGSCIKHQRAEIERLRAENFTLRATVTAVRDALGVNQQSPPTKSET